MSPKLEDLAKITETASNSLAFGRKGFLYTFCTVTKNYNSLRLKRGKYCTRNTIITPYQFLPTFLRSFNKIRFPEKLKKQCTMVGLWYKISVEPTLCRKIRCLNGFLIPDFKEIRCLNLRNTLVITQVEKPG